jgi:predicted alpha/beta-hydrolase family hydrolase
MTRLNITIACLAVIAALICSAYGGPPVQPKTKDSPVKTRGVAGTNTPVFATDGTRLITADMAAEYLPAMSLDVDCPVDIEFVLDSSGSMSSRWVPLKAAVVA